jgi:hypothetical protein
LKQTHRWRKMDSIDAAKPGARGFGNLIGRGVGGQIRLDGEQFGSFSLSVISTRQDRVERGVRK